jgi:hypothetical protein
MPTLHAYVDGSGYYAKASLHGRVVTFQLSSTAAQRLTSAGLGDGARLPGKLLLALIQSGDAFTGAGVAPDDPNQVALPFGDGELDTDGLLPRCEETGEHIDLHLVVLDDGMGGGTKRMRLLALEPRHVLRKHTALSVPVAALSWRALEHLVASGKVPAGAPAVARLRRWLDHQLTSAWDELAKLRAARQEGLAFDRADELPLG